MSNQEHHEVAPIFLGLDLSTQQLKILALQPIRGENGRVSLETHSTFAVHFDSDLPQYNTQGGVAQNHDLESTGVVTTPVLMWVEALELALNRMKREAFPFERVQALSGAAQQHGSVYWSGDAQGAFQLMNDINGQNDSLVDLFRNAFALNQSPIWQDTSTISQCKEIEEYLGSLGQDADQTMDIGEIRHLGQQRLAEITGSRAYERFTGNQILKVIQSNPDVYNATERISLVSSFLASLLIGRYANIDAGDGSGMNLLNIETRTWDPNLVRFVGQGGIEGQRNIKGTLEERLGEVESSGEKVQGVLSSWFVKRYGFRSDAKVVTFTGDNPATVMAMQAEQGDAIVSLGTSDTLLLYTNNHEQPLSHSSQSSMKDQADARLSIGYLCHPVDPNGYLMMYCAKNGSLAREKIRDIYAQRDWDKFNDSLSRAMKDKEKTQELDGRGYFGSKLGFYYFDREIYPPVKGVYRFQSGKLVDEFASGNNNGDDVNMANILSICESQFLAMRVRASQGVPTTTQLAPPGISRILATGGASTNQIILQLLSNIFGVPVLSMSTNEQKGAGSAAWGAARKAFQYGGQYENSSFQENEIDREQEVSPNLKHTKEYLRMIPEFIRLENILLGRTEK